MRYMGSKNRHSKDLLPILLNNREKNQYFVEPFCGSCSIISKVDGNRIANDNNFYLIELYKALIDGWEPPEHLSSEEYKDIKNNKDSYEPHLVGFAGFGCAFGGMWFGSYAKGNNAKGIPRNYCGESKRSLLKQLPTLIDIQFYNIDYYNLNIPDKSIIYCDPPYCNTEKYKHIDSFDNNLFWDWCRKKRLEGHTVYISEYTAPDDFECVWSKTVNSNIYDKSIIYTKRIEKLFIYC